MSIKDGNTGLNPIQGTPLISSMKPTNVRWQVFAMVLVLATVNYIDRSVLSIAMPLISKDLDFSPAIVGVILSSFFWGYALMQVPSGWLADRFGADKVVTGAAVLWGTVQTFSGFAGTATAFMWFRALLGITEAPIFPGAAKLQSVWLTAKDRGKGAFFTSSGGTLGSAIGGPIVVAFIAWFGGWRGALIAAGIMTLLVAWIAWHVIKGSPATNKRMNEAERQYIKEALEEEYEANKKLTGGSGSTVRIRDYFTNRSFLCMNLGWYMWCTIFNGMTAWGPSYLAMTQKIDIKTVGFATLVIFGTGFIGEFVGGVIVDAWRKRGGNGNTVMRTMLSISGIMTGICYFLLLYATSLASAITLLSIALFFLRWGGQYWGVPATICRREDVGKVGGFMNFIGSFAGILTPITIGFIVSLTGSFFGAIAMFATAGILMAIFSNLINFNKKIGVN